MEEFDCSKVIETKRLKLRFIEDNDALAIYYNINHDKEVLKYFIASYFDDPSQATVKRLRESSIHDHRYVFVIIEKESDEVIGMILQCSAPYVPLFNSCEIGYAIGRKYWNKGYVTEATKAFIDFLFSTGIHKICASHFPENIASKRVMEKCGMVFEYRKIDDVFYHDKYHDLMFYYIINPRK